MSIIIFILKIIGIILLSVLVLIIALGLLILLVPARYKIEGSFEPDKKTFSVRITWLFRAVNLLVYNGDAGIIKKITIFGFRLKEKKNDNTNIKNKSDDVENNEEHIADVRNNENSKEAVEQVKGTREKSAEAFRRFEADKESFDREGFFEKIAGRIEKVVQKIKDIYNKICESVKKTQNFGTQIKDFIKDEGNKAAFGRIKTEVLYLIKHFKPRKIEGKLLFGTGDPATTGYFLGGFYVIYQALPLKLDITPDFENKVIDGRISAKGHIRSVHAVLTAIRLFGSADFRRMLKFRKKFAKKNNI